ncbi:hypothetical protein WDU94_006912 [Cyamophila willieti]
MYYDIIRIEPMTLESPWFKLKSNTSLFILYFTTPGYKVKIHIKEENTGNTRQLEDNEIHELDRNNYTEKVQRVLVKVPFAVPDNGIGNQRINITRDKYVFIGNIWEQTNLDIHKERRLVVCKKSNIVDIYNTVERTSTKTKIETSCENGGRLENGTCVCPPGFAGNQCQSPCGRNHFGEKCSFVCSNSSSECKGMILCTPYYGCTCAPGYQGDDCNMQCKEGFYGVDCKLQCVQCPFGCNKYTGACRDVCGKYPMGPNCSQHHSYLKVALDIVESNFTSVKLQVNFTRSKLVGSLENTKMYMVQYRIDTSSWNDRPYEELKQMITNITVNGLKPGRLYQFRVLLIDYSQETQDTLRSKISQAKTTCTLSLEKEELHISRTSTTTVDLFWDKETDLEEMECPKISSLLEIDEMTETGLYYHRLLKSRIIIIQYKT